MMRQVLLASASPRRRELLERAGFAVTVVPAGIEELTPDFLTAGETTLLNAKRKARHVARSNPEALVIGADTLVALEGMIFGKPRDFEDAFQMLRRLSNVTHEVFSGVWISQRNRGLGLIEVSRVRFRELGDDEIRRYLARIDPLDKAGAYAAQDPENQCVASIEGSTTNVIGLPMEGLKEALRLF
jgi:septum formation protein